MMDRPSDISVPITCHYSGHSCMLSNPAKNTSLDAWQRHAKNSKETSWLKNHLVN